MSVHALVLPFPEPAALADTPALLPVPNNAPASAPVPNTRRQVWLAAHLRGWQLHATLAGLAASEREALNRQPIAVVEADRRATLIACNALAHAAGVRVGHSLNAAIALCADMQFLPRDPTAEIALLEKLATHCERYTPTVSIQAPNELLLEVRGSMRLFGGIGALVDLIKSELTEQGLTPQVAVSPTPQSALWLSRAAAAPLIVRPRELIPTIAKLPISHLLWPADLELRLARFGVLSIGDLLRLPRAGLARRIGYDRLAELDHAVGRHREVRKSHRSVQTYGDRVLLDFEIETTGLLSTIIEKRLVRLGRYLTKRTLATDRIHIDLKHRDQPLTPVIIGLAAATSDIAHVVKLMREQFTKLALPAPVVELIIRVERLQEQSSASRDLFGRHVSDLAIATTEPQARLLEQLRSRLGEQSIRRITAVPDYRPEIANSVAPATVTAEPQDCAIPPGLAPRPLWLLSIPRPLRVTRRLQSSILSGPEVLEGGWWDGVPVHRDYCVARSSRGALAWIFRESSGSQQQFVHGLFG